MAAKKWSDAWKAKRKYFDEQVALGRSKSALFTEFANEGMSPGDIAFVCSSHYSFVYGVVSTKTTTVVKKESNTSDQIRELADQGKTVGEISHLLNVNYSWCHTVVKKHKAQ